MPLTFGRIEMRTRESLENVRMIKEDREDVIENAGSLIDAHTRAFSYAPIESYEHDGNERAQHDAGQIGAPGDEPTLSCGGHPLSVTDLTRCDELTARFFHTPRHSLPHAIDPTVENSVPFTLRSYMRNVVLGFMFCVVALVASESQAASRINCRSGEYSVDVDIDVLESNPPQSQVTVQRYGTDWGSYATFTEYRLLKSNPPQYQWRFESRDTDSLLIVTTAKPEGRNPRTAKGTYRYNKATSPLFMDCIVR